MGRVGGDPQKRGTQEHPVVVFSVATHSNYNYQTGKLCDYRRLVIGYSVLSTLLHMKTDMQFNGKTQNQNFFC